MGRKNKRKRLSKCGNISPNGKPYRSKLRSRFRYISTNSSIYGSFTNSWFSINKFSNCVEKHSSIKSTFYITLK